MSLVTFLINSFDVIWGVLFEFADYFYLRERLKETGILKEAN
jgi:hypothetical protein